MKRLDRLVAIALLLGARRRLRASDLAEHFGVSLRTVYRDVRALGEAGYPVAGSAGDGYTLAAPSPLRPLALDPGEAESLALAARTLAATSDPALADRLRTALAKLEAMLTPEAMRRARDHRRYVLMPEGTGKKTVPLGVFLQATADREVLDVSYDGIARAERTRRAVEPLGIIRLGDVWLVAAYCRLRADLRTFRLDRVRRATPTGERFEPRDGMTLADVVRRAETEGSSRRRIAERGAALAS